jgi:hypothetical protein
MPPFTAKVACVIRTGYLWPGYYWGRRTLERSQRKRRGSIGQVEPPRDLLWPRGSTFLMVLTSPPSVDVNLSRWTSSSLAFNEPRRQLVPVFAPLATLGIVSRARATTICFRTSSWLGRIVENRAFSEPRKWQGCDLRNVAMSGHSAV